jgi:cytochrome c oxidase cbb3-type subunit 4
MAIEQIFDSASSVMTVISFVTFVGILVWTFILRRGADFDTAAQLPFADEACDAPATGSESRHG